MAISIAASQNIRQPQRILDLINGTDNYSVLSTGMHQFRGSFVHIYLT